MEKVSIVSVIGMIFSMLIAIGMPMAAFLFWRKKTGASIKSFFQGAVTIFLSALVLERILHLIVFGVFGEALTGNRLLYALYGGAAAGIFEETGRFLTMKYWMKKSLKKKNAIMYGIGHGGIESILLGGTAMMSNVLTAAMINAGSLESSLNSLDELSRSAALEQVSALWTTKPYLFYLGGVERISAFFLQICFSYLVYRAVRYAKMEWYLSAVFLHFSVDAGSALLNGAIPTLLLEAVLLVLACVLLIFVYRTYQQEAVPERASASCG